MKAKFESLEQANNLREVQALKRLSPHPQIIKLVELIFEKSTGTLALVFELMEMNLYELIKGRRMYLPEKTIKSLIWQLFKGIAHMHQNGIFHRDMKPENVVLKDDKLKLIDFGSCRGIRSKPPFTEYISTRWYRAPECLLTDGYYNYKMDIWGIGCVWFEILSLFPLFPGSDELDQIQKIHNILGTPPREVLAKLRKHSAHMNFNFPAKEGTGLARLLPNATPEGLDLITRLLAYDPDERISAQSALTHPYFRDMRERERLLKQGAQIVNEPTATSTTVPPPHRHHKEKEETQYPPIDNSKATTATSASTNTSGAAASASSTKFPAVADKHHGSSSFGSNPYSVVSQSNLVETNLPPLPLNKVQPQPQPQQSSGQRPAWR